MVEHRLSEPVYAALRQIIDPCSAASASPMNLVEMGLVREVTFSEDDSRVDIHLRLTSPQCLMIAYMTKAARGLITQIAGVTQVEVHADHGLDWSPSMIEEAAQHRRRLQLQVLSDASQTAGCGSHQRGKHALAT